MKVLEKTESRLVIRQSGGKNLLFMGPLFFVLGAGAFFILAQTRTIYCERIEPQLVQCEIATSFLGLPLDPRTVDGFRSAYVAESSNSTYRVILTGRDGNTALTNYNSSGYSEKQEIANELNRFVNSSREDSVTVHDRPGILKFLFGFIFMGCGLFMLTLAIQRLTYTLDRVANSFVYDRRGIFGRKVKSFQLDEIVDAYVEEDEDRYRPVISFANGERVPLFKMYSSGREDKEQLVEAIVEFIGRERPGEYT